MAPRFPIFSYYYNLEFINFLFRTKIPNFFDLQRYNILKTWSDGKVLISDSESREEIILELKCLPYRPPNFFN